MLQHQPVSSQAQVFLITSAAPSEGKSFCAVQLGLTFANSGLRTLVVDADLRRPNLAKSLDMSMEAGLGVEALIDEGVDFGKLIRPTDIKNFSVALTRTAPDLAQIIISGTAFHRFLMEMRQRFDRIIVDSAPVGAVGDSIALASQVDGTIWATRFNKVPRRVVLEAFSRLVQTRAKVFGVILNDLDLSKKSNYYYYSYKYYSKYYHRASQDKEAGKS
jgi:capsular exopolysaccharide synthesis family protein